MASTAQSFRSRWGSEFGLPEYKQRSPGATPQVGQGTEDNCFGVRSVILIRIECDKPDFKVVLFGTSLTIRILRSLQRAIPQELDPQSFLPLVHLNDKNQAPAPRTHRTLTEVKKDEIQDRNDNVRAICIFRFARCCAG
jgi:hypothetical protein